MRDEIAAAVVFLTRVVKEDTDNAGVKDHLEKFSDSLTTLLRERFKNHWYEDKPHKGQAYRCIRVNRVSPDPVLQKALDDSGLKLNELQLHNELTLWVDPSEVTCRIGEQWGSTYHTIAAFNKNGQTTNQAHTMNIAQMLEHHNQKRNQALSNVLQASSSRVNAGSPKNDAGVVLDGFYNPFSPGKQHRMYHHRQHAPPPPGRYNKYSYNHHHRASPPFEFGPQRGGGSPPFLPNVHAPVNNGYPGSARHWMRGPDLVKA